MDTGKNSIRSKIHLSEIPNPICYFRTDGCVDPRTFIPPGEEEISSFEGKRRMFSDNAREKTVEENKVGCR